MVRKVFRTIPTGIRGYRSPRCPRCWMEQKECICSLIPHLDTKFRVVIIMPWKESGRSSNTGRLVNLALVNSEVRLRGKPGAPLDLSDLSPGGLLLYPGQDSSLLTSSMEMTRGPHTLIVPDGTWRQASRIVRAHEVLRNFKQVHLPPGTPSIYSLRKQKQTSRVCTFEAVARALEILEGPGLEKLLMPALEAMVSRTLRARGKLARD